MKVFLFSFFFKLSEVMDRSLFLKLAVKNCGKNEFTLVYINVKKKLHRAAFNVPF